MINIIKLYIVDSDEYEDEEEKIEDLEWSEVKPSIPLSIIKPGDKRFFVYTYGDGTFEINSDEQTAYMLNPYRKKWVTRCGNIL